MASYDFTSSSGIASAASDLASSVQAAIAAAQASSTTDTESTVDEYQKTVRKSSINTAMKATDIGVLAKQTSRLNVVSSLSAKDPADFYSFRVTTKGEATLGRVGDEGARVQVMTKLGVVVADSNKDSGANYDSYQKLQQGALSLDAGQYTLRVTRDKGVDAGTDLNYAYQLSMGAYTKDYDTVVQQADPSSENTTTLPTDVQGLLSVLSSGLDSNTNGLFTAGQTTSSSSDLIGVLFDGYV